MRQWMHHPGSSSLEVLPAAEHYGIGRHRLVAARRRQARPPLDEQGHAELRPGPPAIRNGSHRTGDRLGCFLGRAPIWPGAARGIRCSRGIHRPDSSGPRPRGGEWTRGPSIHSPRGPARSTRSFAAHRSRQGAPDQPTPGPRIHARDVVPDPFWTDLWCFICEQPPSVACVRPCRSHHPGPPIARAVRKSAATCPELPRDVGDVGIADDAEALGPR